MHTKIAIGTKDIFRNQHRLIRFIEQSIRLCSTQSLKTAEKQQQEQQLKSEHDFEITKSINAKFTNAQGQPKQIEHAPHIGQQFSHLQLSTRLARPDQLNPKPSEDEEIGFGKLFTDHMLKIYYHKSLGGWQKPEITPLENLTMHPAAKVLHYAVELFEGMKAFRGVDGKIRMFRPDMNMHRMNLSAKRCGLPTFEGREFIKCLSRLISIDSEWVPHHESASLYIRPTLIGIDPTLGVASSDSALLYTILSPVGNYFKTNGAVSLLADPKYTRAWPGGCGDRKMGSNYAPTIQIQELAIQGGLDQVLWLYGEDHQLTEVGTMNLFMYYINDEGEKELTTPPLNGLILPGITRSSILALSSEWGKYKVTEKNITMPQIVKLLEQGRVLEMFGSGTACVITPIKGIYYENRMLNIPTMEHEKPVHDLIKETLLSIQYGHIEHPWAEVIEL